MFFYYNLLLSYYAYFFNFFLFFIKLNFNFLFYWKNEGKNLVL